LLAAAAANPPFMPFDRTQLREGEVQYTYQSYYGIIQKIAVSRDRMEYAPSCWLVFRGLLRQARYIITMHRAQAHNMAAGGQGHTV
jgi:hypothetical protein